MPGTPKTSPWRDEAVVDELRRLVLQKLTTALIADALYVKFRHPFTRNAVIGQMHKLGISTGLKGGKAAKNSAPTPRSVSRQHQRLGSPYFGTRTSVPVAKAVRATEAIVDPATQVSLFDHREGQCRWPVTEVQPISAFRYCGDRVADDACPYCAAHSRMSVTRYRPAEAA